MTGLPDEYFAAMYRRTPDPWGFDDRWYEERKRALSTAVLPRKRFRNAFEPGCSIGTFTADLLGRCERVLATDIADAALDATRRRHAEAVQAGRLHLSRWSLRDPWPDNIFDLIVLSEVGYYLSESELQECVRGAFSQLADDGVLLAVHWRHPVAEYPLTGDRVHEIIGAQTGVECTARYADPDVLIETYASGRATTLSVARAEGLDGA